MPTPFDPQVLLTRPLMAILSSVSSDATPCNAPVWFLWEDDALWMLGSEDSSSVRRLTSRPACAVEITEFDPAVGILLHLGLRGSANIEPNDPARFRRLLNRYLGKASDWNQWFVDNIARIDDPAGRFIRLRPDSMFTNNVSYFRSGPDLAWP
ncbi:pyridoxamine 5'-phosphate oxidase family protein [Pontivivens nitratireducens]|uniref:Pyridoxamine 5'-phosphate oxidase n=1 Tax=Pontivivens nitratireducens TaxID=2758038 RepID=A0A6G7VJ90_9RHOB|nr:pyridoxamine 5'-phosphate oxidase family protein [Pontibrevibacter nitratireducens]QIK39960.1 pyridoxamine 5'-phosphate oxidase [Pontibrevibacter nitratireducens]